MAFDDENERTVEIGCPGTVTIDLGQAYDVESVCVYGELQLGAPSRYPAVRPAQELPEMSVSFLGPGGEEVRSAVITPRGET